MDRTIRVQLHPMPEQAQALKETLRQFTDAFDAVCTYGWQHAEKNGVKLHHATYYQLRAHFPHLNANVLIQARIKATEALKSAFTWKARHEASYPKKVAKALARGKPAPKFKPVKCPQSTSCPIRYNERTYGLSWTSQTVSLSTTNGRIILPFTVPVYCAKYQGYPVAMADLCYRKGKWWLHVVVSVPEPTVPKDETVIGIDLGLNHPAVTSTRQFLGSPRWKELDRRYFRIRRKLQSKGSKSAKRHLKKLSHRQACFHRDCDHVLSRRIVQQTPPGATLVLENLSHIRDTSKIGRGKQNKNVANKRRLHSWTFAQLYDFIAYKGQECGIAVVKIDPRHTSQTCSHCGYQHRSNRRSQSLFLCRKCGYCLNADLNASYNIREKYLTALADFGRPLVGGSPCQAAYRLDASASGTSPRL
jgi:IS605 OrfB family transposase